MEILREFLLIGGNLLLILQLGCGSRSFEKTLEVKELFWQRTVYIEEYTTVTEEAWADELPQGVKKISSVIVPKGARVVLGTKDYTETEKYNCTTSVPSAKQPAMKTCERTVTRTQTIQGILPEDRERITYETRHWQEADKTKAQVSSGDDTQEPNWKEPQVDNKTTRLGRRNEFYSVTFSTVGGESKTYEHTFSFKDWLEFKRGQKYKATFSSPSSEPLIGERLL
jgi:hypothetical protein